MKKRILSLLMVLVILLAELPCQAFADGSSVSSVTYSRLSLESPVLNAVNGKDEDYVKYIAISAYRYNNCDEFKSGSDPIYISAKKNSGDYVWSSYGSSNLAVLANSTDLQIGLTGVCYNDIDHSHKRKLKKYTMNPYASVYLYNAGSYVTGLSGGISKYYNDAESVQGVTSYYDLTPSYGNTSRSLKVSYSAIDISYADKVCTCHTGFVGSLGVLFYDDTAPGLSSVSLSGGTDGKNFKAGDTIQVHLVFDEPVRFADDSAAHGDTYVELVPEGETAGSSKAMKAYLVSLEDKYKTCSYQGDYQVHYSEAIFEYTVPADDTTTDITIGSVNLGTLKKDCSLTIYGGGYGMYDSNYQTYLSSKLLTNSGYGYDKAKSVFTDLAGNSFADFSSKTGITGYIDCVSTNVVKISASAETNNTAVKTALGKTTADFSDNALGVGDTITFKVYFDEVINWTSASQVKTIKAETNLKDSSGDAIVVEMTSSSYGQEYYSPDTGKGASNSKVSYVTLDKLTITSGMYCTDADGKIRINRIYFSEDVTDFSGNKYAAGDKVLTDLSQTIYYLDNVAPTASAVKTAESDGSYNPVLSDSENSTDGFRFDIALSDTRVVSSSQTVANGLDKGVEGLSGSFTLTNSDSSSDNFNFQYATSSSATTDLGTLDWKSGKSGSECSFTQHENTYFYIKFNDGESYNLARLNLSVYAVDYAGNKSSANTFTINYTLDNHAPELSAAAASRSLNSDKTGTLTVSVSATDPSGFSTSSDDQIVYQWTSSADVSPAADGWTKASVSGSYSAGATTFTANAVYTIPENSSYSGCLWVKFKDVWGNESEAVKVGQYGYDLAAPGYTLNYSSTLLLNTAAVTLKSLDSGAGLLTLARTSDMVDSNGNEVWFLNYTESNTTYLLDKADRLVYCTVSGIYYTFTDYTGTNSWSNYLDPTSKVNSLHGELNVITIVGKKEAFTVAEGERNYKTISGAGSDTYPVYAQPAFTLKISSKCAKSNGSYLGSDDWVSGSLDISGTGKDSTYEALTEDDGYETLLNGGAILSSLEDLTFTLNLSDKQMPSWGIDAIDFSSGKTYLHITRWRYVNGYQYETYNIPLLALSSQQVVIPASVTEQLGSGYYAFSLHYTMKNGYYGDISLSSSGEYIRVETSGSSVGARIGYYEINLGDVSSSTNLVKDEKYLEDTSALRYEYQNNYADSGTFVGDDYVIDAADEGAQQATPQILVIPASQAVVSDSVSAQSTGSGGFLTRLQLYVDDFDTYEEDIWTNVRAGLRWIKITNTVGDTTVEKWALFQSTGGGAFTDQAGRWMTLYLYPTDSAEEMKDLEDDFKDNGSVHGYNLLGVVRNTTNVVTFEVYGMNGTVSSKRTMYINPKSDPVTGTVTNVATSHTEDAINDLNGVVRYATDMRTIFTPTAGTDTSNLKVYLRYSNYFGATAENSQDFEMSLSDDGTYFYLDRDPDMPYYKEDTPTSFCICVVNQDTGYVSNQIVGKYSTYYNCWINDKTDLKLSFDKDAPELTSLSMKDTGGGCFEISYILNDKVLDEGGEITMALYPSAEYADVLNLDEDACFTFTFSKEYSLKTSTQKYTVCRWTLEDSVNNLGIYQAVANISYYETGEATVTIKGVVPSSEALEGTTIKAAFELAVWDRFGNADRDTDGEIIRKSVSASVVSHEPTVTNIYSTVNQLPDFSVATTFNQPVVIEENWRCQDVSGYSTTKTDELPISTDGSGTIDVWDVFGNVHQAEYTSTGQFNFGSAWAYGVDVEFSTTELTTGLVTITVSRADEDASWPEIMRNDSMEQYADKKNKSSRSMTVSENGWYEFLIYSRKEAYYYDSSGNDDAYVLRVYVGNIVHTAPAAELSIYLEEFSQSFTPETLPNRNADGTYNEFKTTGSVKVSYRTARDVTPAEGNATEVWFSSKSTSDSYTFKYSDELGCEGSASFDLSDYGIILTDPPEPYQDTEAPVVQAAVYSKAGGSYERGGGFLASASAAQITESLTDCGYVQGYKLLLSVDDYSSVKTVIKASAPGTITYESAESDVITGVTQKGNAILIDGTAGGSFYVVCVDNASGDSAASSDNVTTFRVEIPEAMLDTTSPEAKLSFQYTTLYMVDYSIELLDRNNQKVDITTDGGITLYSGELVSAGTTAEGHPLYTYSFKENGSLSFSYADMAGNLGFSSISVSDLDMSSPTLTQTWSPCARIENDGVVTRDSSLAPNYLLNTDIKLKVGSSNNIVSVAAYYICGDTKPAEDDWWNSFDGTDTSVVKSLEIGVDTIDIVFNKKGCSYGAWVKLVVTRDNGKSTTLITGFGSGIVDAEDIEFQVTATPITRDGSTTADPYAYKIKIYPYKSCYCSTEAPHVDDKGVMSRNMYEMGSIKGGDSKPFETTIYQNTSYTWTFVDEAGNWAAVQLAMPSDGSSTVASYQWITEGKTENRDIYDAEMANSLALVYLDSTAPVITLSPSVEELAAMDTVGSVGVDITLTADEDCTVSYRIGDSSAVKLNLKAGVGKNIHFSKNGVFSLTATDAALNASYVTVPVGNIDTTAPEIDFTKSSVTIRQDAEEAELTALLDSGVSAYDLRGSVRTDLSYTYDKSSVKLDQVGVYKVTYTATDSVGNQKQAVRYVKVYDKNQPGIELDGEAVDPNGIISLNTGAHTIKVTNINEISAGEYEPYTLYVRKGIYSAGQMKGTRNLVSVGTDGSLTLETGYYTVYVITQSRQSFRAILFVEK